MPCLYVTEPYAVVRKSGESLVVTLDEDPDQSGPLPEKRKTLLEVEPHLVELVALVGSAHITADATRLCLEKGIGIAWFSWNGEFLGRIVPREPRNADLRLLQYAAAHDPPVRLARARAVVAAKLANAVAVLRAVQSNDPGNTPLSEAIAAVKDLEQRAHDCPTAEELLGVEGAATRAYFGGYATAFRADIRFETRQRQPPPDPANALLSFGYVLLGNLIAGAAEARGLDPALGFYHEIRAGRPSLALDLLEELRHPVVDRFVLRVCNLRVLKPADFEPDPDEPGGVRLTREALKAFFTEWGKYLARPVLAGPGDARLAVLPLIRRQVDALAADLRGQGPYAPARFEG